MFCDRLRARSARSRLFCRCRLSFAMKLPRPVCCCGSEAGVARQRVSSALGRRPTALHHPQRLKEELCAKG